MTLGAYSIYHHTLVSLLSIFLGNCLLVVLSFRSVSIQFLVSGQRISFLSYYYTVEPPVRPPSFAFCNTEFLLAENPWEQLFRTNIGPIRYLYLTNDFA